MRASVRRILSVLLSLAMIMGSFSLPVYAEETELLLTDEEVLVEEDSSVEEVLDEDDTLSEGEILTEENEDSESIEILEESEDEELSDSEELEDYEVLEELEELENTEELEELEDTEELESPDEESGKDTEDIDLKLDSEEQSEENALGYNDPHLDVPLSYNEDEFELMEAIPASYDSRTKGYVTPVRNQNPYGTCWAHAALATMESSLLAAGTATDQTKDLAERHLVYFASNTGSSPETAIKDPLDNTDGDYSTIDPGYKNECFNMGGNNYMATLTLSRWEGGAQESKFKYSNKGIAETTENAYSAVAHLQNVRFISMEQPDKIKRAIMKYGAVETDYCHNDYCFNSKTSSYYYPYADYTNHAVTIVGWDDNYSASKFKSGIQPSGDGAWLVKNSWGTAWGNKGYFWLSYYDASAYMVTVYEAEPADNYDHNYFNAASNSEWTANGYSFANVYTARGDETLRSVGIMLNSADTEYTISIYTGVGTSNPKSGTLRNTTTGKTDHAGFYTIPLSSPVSLSKNQKFSVVFEFKSLVDVYLDEDSTSYFYGSSTSFRSYDYSFSKAGESFYYPYKSWMDLSVDNQNLRIHAYTDDRSDEVTLPTSVSFDNVNVNDGLTVAIGDSFKVHTSVTPANAEDHFVWTSSNENVATVDALGNITGIAQGQTVIKATSEVNASVYGTFTVRVVKELMSLSITGSDYVFLDASYTVPYYEWSDEYNINIAPADFLDGSGIVPVWSSSNNNVFTVQPSADGKTATITPVNVGVAKLSVNIAGTVKEKSVYVDCRYLKAEDTRVDYCYNGTIMLSWPGIAEAKYYAIWDEKGNIIDKVYETGKESYTYAITRFKGKGLPWGTDDYFYDVSAFADQIQLNGTKTEQEYWNSSDAARLTIDTNYFNNRYINVIYENTSPVGGSSSDNAYCGEGYTFNDAIPFDGYEFMGWNTETDGSGISYYPCDLIDDKIADSVVVWTGTLSSWEPCPTMNYVDTPLVLYGQWEERRVDTPKIIGDGEYNAGYIMVQIGFEVKLSCDTDGAEIYYTTDGYDPRYYGTKYEDSIVLENDEGYFYKYVTIKAVAKKDGYYTSDVASKVYWVLNGADEWGDIPEELQSEYSYDARNVPAGFWVSGIEDRVYQASAITFPDMKVFYGKTLLTAGKDYTVKYANNVNAADASAKKAPSVTITGKGNYGGKIIKKFTIEPYDLYYNYMYSSDVSVFNVTTVYNGKVQKLSSPVTVTFGEKSVTLKANKDYTLDFSGSDFTNPGTYGVIVNAKEGGNYTGYCYYDETIEENGIMASKLSVTAIPNQVYTGNYLQLGGEGDSEIKLKNPFVVKAGKTVLTEGIDYYIGYDNNQAVGTASVIIQGRGNQYGNIAVYGEKIINFKITGTPVNKLAVSGIPKSVPYTGFEYTCSDDDFENLKLYVKASKKAPEKVLEKGTDYAVHFTNNIKAGTATITFTGNPERGYSGTLKKTFKITPYNVTSNADERLTLTLEDCGENPNAYSMEFVKGGVKPVPKVYDNTSGQELVANVDYTVSYSNNKAVNNKSNTKKLPTVNIKGKGNYSGTNKQLTFAITAKDVNNNAGGVTVNAGDVVYKNKPGNYKASVTIKDSDGSKLGAGKDYDKNVVYRYAIGTTVSRKNGTSIYRTALSVVDKDDIVPAGTRINIFVTAKGSYVGTMKGSYRVVAASISKAKIKLKNNASITPGKNVEFRKSDLTVTVGKDQLTNDDYDITGYSNNVNAGNATITIQGKGNYGGTCTAKFKINKLSLF